MLAVPPLPYGDQTPSLEEMAGLLVEALPEQDRDKGRRVLLDKVFPRSLAHLSAFPDPRYLAEWVYEEIADELEGAEPEERLDTLNAFACGAEVRHLDRESLSMAIARYLKDHPADLNTTSVWVDPTVRDWLVKPLKEISAGAADRLKKLETWALQAQIDFPDVWKMCRLKYQRVHMALTSARTGDFQSASGNLYDFLCDLGFEPELAEAF